MTPPDMPLINRYYSTAWRWDDHATCLRTEMRTARGRLGQGDLTMWAPRDVLRAIISHPQLVGRMGAAYHRWRKCLHCGTTRAGEANCVNCGGGEWESAAPGMTELAAVALDLAEVREDERFPGCAIVTTGGRSMVFLDVTEAYRP